MHSVGNSGSAHLNCSKQLSNVELLKFSSFVVVPRRPEMLLPHCSLHMP